MSLTIYCKYKNFHSTVQRAEDRRQKFHFCRLAFAVNVMLNLSINNVMFPTGLLTQKSEEDRKCSFSHLMKNQYIYQFFYFIVWIIFLCVRYPGSKKCYVEMNINNKRYETRGYSPKLVTYIKLSLNSALPWHGTIENLMKKLHRSPVFPFLENRFYFDQVDKSYHVYGSKKIENYF